MAKCIIVYEAPPYPMMVGNSGVPTLRCTTHNCSNMVTLNECIMGILEEMRERLDRIEEMVKYR